jgi:hypothetical protein
MQSAGDRLRQRSNWGTHNQQPERHDKNDVTAGSAFHSFHSPGNGLPENNSTKLNSDRRLLKIERSLQFSQ